MNILVFLLIGAVAGWLAGLLVKGHGFGLLGNIVVGIIGAVIGGWVLPKVGVSMGGDLVGSIITATVGAALLLFVAGLLRRGSR